MWSGQTVTSMTSTSCTSLPTTPAFWRGTDNCWRNLSTKIRFFSCSRKNNDYIKFSKVDMKIMYYELIKMLIEYERNKQPEVRNTKSLSAKQSPCLFESH